MMTPEIRAAIKRLVAVGEEARRCDKPVGRTLYAFNGKEITTSDLLALAPLLEGPVELLHEKNCDCPDCYRLDDE